MPHSDGNALGKSNHNPNPQISIPLNCSSKWWDVQGSKKSRRINIIALCIFLTWTLSRQWIKAVSMLHIHVKPNWNSYGKLSYKHAWNALSKNTLDQENYIYIIWKTVFPKFWKILFSRNLETKIYFLKKTTLPSPSF